MRATSSPISRTALLPVAALIRRTRSISGVDGSRGGGGLQRQARHDEQRRAQLDWLLPALHAVPEQGASVTGTSDWPGLPAVDVPQDFLILNETKIWVFHHICHLN